MKVATGIIALVLMIVIGLQSCAVGVGGAMLNSESGKEGASVGIVVALVFLFAGAFAFAKPLVSMIFFLIAAVLGWAVGGTTSFTDMTVWGFVSLILAVMSFSAWRSDKKKRRQQLSNHNIQG